MFNNDVFLGCDKKIIEFLETLPIKEREYFIFKKFYESRDTLELKKYYDTIGMRFFIGGIFASRLYNKAVEGGYSSQCFDRNLLNREIYSDVICNLYCLFNKMSTLAGELSYKSSLEYSILFYFLLRKGYLSKNKKYKFSDKNLMYIRGLLFADIANGNGVCLNDSHLLKEFLNYCGFNSMCLINYHDSKSIYVDDYLDLHDDIDTFERKFHRILWYVKNKESNHAYNLIKDNNGFYIFDSTNGIFNKISDIRKSSVINGKGINRIYFYESFDHCNDDKDVKLLDSFFRANNYDAPYSDEEFRIISEYCMDIIKKNIKLIEDFYDCARSDIYGISDETFKIREKILFTK